MAPQGDCNISRTKIEQFSGRLDYDWTDRYYETKRSSRLVSLLNMNRRLGEERSQKGAKRGSSEFGTSITGTDEESLTFRRRTEKAGFQALVVAIRF